jgi:hypothetical protein
MRIVMGYIWVCEYNAYCSSKNNHVTRWPVGLLFCEHLFHLLKYNIQIYQQRSWHCKVLLLRSKAHIRAQKWSFSAMSKASGLVTELKEVLHKEMTPQTLAFSGQLAEQTTSSHRERGPAKSRSQLWKDVCIYRAINGNLKPNPYSKRSVMHSRSLKKHLGVSGLTASCS